MRQRRRTEQLARLQQLAARRTAGLGKTATTHVVVSRHESASRYRKKATIRAAGGQTVGFFLPATGNRLIDQITPTSRSLPAPTRRFEKSPADPGTVWLKLLASDEKSAIEVVPS